MASIKICPFVHYMINEVHKLPMVVIIHQSTKGIKVPIAQRIGINPTIPQKRHQSFQSLFMDKHPCYYNKDDIHQMCAYQNRDNNHQTYQ